MLIWIHVWIFARLPVLKFYVENQKCHENLDFC
jgi:hypothetical protein